MEPKWLDAPFFNLLEDFASLQGYFMVQAMFIAKIVLTLNLGFIAIKYIAKGEGISEQLMKVLMSVIMFLIIVNSYPLMIQGLNRIIYSWSYGSTYGKVAEMIQKTTSGGEATDFWETKSNDPDAYSDIIKVLEQETGKGNVAKKYVLDIFDKGSAKRPGMFIRPNAVMRLLMLTFETIWNKAVTCLEPVGGMNFLPKDMGGFLLLTITGLAVIGAGIFTSLQYFIGAIEFTFITSVGVIMLPFMLWDGTKFLTEKLVGAIVGQALKLLFVTLCFMLAINGFLTLMVRPFDSHIDQMIYTMFTVFFYWLLCLHGPALATALLTGTPQLSMGEGMATAAAMGGAAIAAAKGVQSTASAAVKTGVQAKSAGDKAFGSAGAAKADGKRVGGMIAAGARSLGDSAKDSVKSGVHGLAQSLTKGKGGGAGGGSSGGGSSGKNRWSTLQARNDPKADGNRKTSKEFGQENRAKGAERYQQDKHEAKGKEVASWKAGISNNSKPAESAKRYEGGTPLGQNIPKRTPGPASSTTTEKPSGGNSGKSS